MEQAERFGRPIITFIDTPGAYPGIEAEQYGQSQAIANNLARMSSLAVPIISIVTGEGSSGGALAIGVANRVFMLENAIYSILSPEGFSTILWNDASKKETYASMVEEVMKNEGKIDILVNNFGTSNPQKDKDIKTTEYEEYIHTVDMNLASVFMTTQAVIPHMAANGGGSIINISSVGGIRPDISQIAYGTSKAAINYLTKLIATQCARDNIRCNAVLPGMTATEAVSGNLTPEFQAFFLKHIPIKRMGTPEEIAGAVAYFASDDAAYTTGQIMDVSGGFGMPTPIFGDMIEMKSKR